MGDRLTNVDIAARVGFCLFVVSIVLHDILGSVARGLQVDYPDFISSFCLLYTI